MRIRFQMKKNKEISDIDKGYFLKDNIIFNKLDARCDSFYKEKYKKYTAMSFFFAVGTFVISTVGHQTIIVKNSNQKTFLTNVLGETVEYVDTDSRKNVVQATLRNINNRKK